MGALVIIIEAVAYLCQGRQLLWGHAHDKVLWYYGMVAIDDFNYLCPMHLWLIIKCLQQVYINFSVRVACGDCPRDLPYSMGKG